MEVKPTHVVIIGNGISGITAARHIRKRSNCAITVISSESRFFFSRTALMYVYMGHMKFENTMPYEESFWKKNRISLVFDHVQSVNVSSKSLSLKSGESLSYSQLIIATGSQYNTLALPGSNLKGVQGLYSYQDLIHMEQNTGDVREAVVVGGGLIGIEMAEMLHSRNIKVTFLVREPEFWSNVLPLPEAKLISNHIRNHSIDLRLETELKEIVDADGKVKAVITTAGEVISCQFVGLTIGVSPNIEFLKTSGIQLNRGVLVNEYLQTNVPDVYAIGDCAERGYDLTGRKRIEQVWYTGRMMGEVVAQTICGTPTSYAPGPWFNSAKFFDIEFQTYGNVAPVLGENEEELYWEHASEKKAVHFVWQKQNRVFKGVNAFGIRLRHESFDRWLRESRTIDFVIDHLAEANFDPEFFERHEAQIHQQFKSTVVA